MMCGYIGDVTTVNSEEIGQVFHVHKISHFRVGQKKFENRSWPWLPDPMY